MFGIGVCGFTQRREDKRSLFSKKMKKLVHYIKVWFLMVTNAVQVSFASRFGAALLFTGKSIRFVLFLVLLFLVAGRVEKLAGYSLEQMIFFFLTFNVIDTTAQFLYRQVYRFRPLIVRGDFDLTLVKPVHPLLLVLLGGADILDFIMLIPFVGAIVYVALQGGWLTLPNVFLYVLLLLNALLIATAFHIAVLAFGILTTAVDHTIMIYRDLTSMGRIPVDFYAEPIRGLLTFAIPVGIMMTVPAKALMGILNPAVIIYSLAIGVVSIFLALRFWHFSLARYSSASS